MGKKIKLKKKIFLNDFLTRKKWGENFQIICNFSNHEMSKTIYSNCLVCSNFDFFFVPFRSNLRLNFHFPEHSSVILSPNFVVFYIFELIFKEEFEMIKALRVLGNFDWEKIHGLKKKGSLLQNQSRYNIQIKKKGIRNVYYIGKIPQIEKCSLEKDNKVDFLKIWNIFLENKINWNPQRGEKFFEWRNTTEKKT
mmetsp:Transcript_28159/g.57115  ORF Transcript_28159/g.57115 Transcript_28159/m.57115 type:complete len:195 (+) Transcript_28159:79-663(+)